MRTNQLALRAFNVIALVHPLLKSRTLLLAPPRLQMVMMFAYHQRAMFLNRADALLFEGTRVAMGAKLETITNSSSVFSSKRLQCVFSLPAGQTARRW